MSAFTLADVDTPFAVLDHAKLVRNVGRLATRLDGLGVPLRPHVKTAKCVDVAERMLNGRPGPITVSTLAEAEAFADAGYTDITYAVGLAPDKLPRVESLIARGVDLTVLVDSVAQAKAIAGLHVPALIEIDCDGHRGGVTTDDPALVEIGSLLNGSAELRGVLVHAGESYFADTPAALAEAAENERAVADRAATVLRDAGLPCPVVSVGSTPTAHAAADLSGVTEVRAGNYVFFDLVMAGIGVCSIDDIALSVTVSVIGHRPDKGWIITDGGWMAMSRDRGTARQRIDQGYGVVTTLDGIPYPDLVMSQTSQEHGTLSVRPESSAPLPDLPVGTRLRILPNHACATAAQHDSYQVINLADIDTASAPVIDATWQRIRGW